MNLKLESARLGSAQLNQIQLGDELAKRDGTIQSG